MVDEKACYVTILLNANERSVGEIYTRIDYTDTHSEKRRQYMQKLINTQVLRLWNWILIMNLPRMCTKPSSFRYSRGRQWKSVKQHVDEFMIFT